MPPRERRARPRPAGQNQDRDVFDTSGGGGGGAVNSVTGGTGITDSGTAADPVLDHDAHTGDVTGATALTIPSNTVTYAKMQNIVADNTLLGNNSGPNQDPQELSATQARTLLNVEDGATAEVDATTTVKGIVELATDGESISNVVVQGNDGRLSDARTPTSHASTHTDGTDDVADLVGDSGSGGTHGLVPAPAAGDAAANKFLKADASWAIPAGGGGARRRAGSVCRPGHHLRDVERVRAPSRRRRSPGPGSDRVRCRCGSWCIAPGFQSVP